MAASTSTAVKPTKAEVYSPHREIHHMIRGLAAEEGPGVFTGDQLDAHCKTWLDQGYKLLSAHPTYVKPEQGPGGTSVSGAQWHILYIFIKE